MGKMAMGLVATLGKGLISRGTTGGARGMQGNMGDRGRQRQTDPLEEVLRLLLDRGREREKAAADARRSPVRDGGDAGLGVPVVPSAATEAEQSATAGNEERAAALAALLAHVTSFTDGRVRLRHPALRERAFHAPLRELLERADCFTGLTFSQRAGSLLLEYVPQRHSRADFWEAALPVGFFLARCA